MTPNPTPAELEQAQAAATPRPWFFAYNRIVSLPVSHEYDAIERTFPDDIADDDPRWDTLPDPDVAGVHTSHGDTASPRGAADATLICHAVNLLPAHLAQIAAQAARIAELEAEVVDLNIALVDWQTSDMVARSNLADAKDEIERLRTLAQGASK